MLKKLNYAIGQVATGISDSATSVTLKAGHTITTPTGETNKFRAVFYASDKTSPYGDTTREIVEAYRTDTNVFTIARAQESTAAKAWSENDNLMLVASAAVYDEYETELGNKIEADSTDTLTNKRLTPRITTITSHATPTINTDNCDVVDITALAEAITNMSTNLSGTPTNFQKLIFRILDDGDTVTDTTITSGGTGYTAGNLVVDNTGTGGTGFAGTYTVAAGVIDSITITDPGSGYTTAPSIDGDAGGSASDLSAVLGGGHAIAWGTSFEANGVALPTTTVARKLLTVGFIYNGTKWGCVASVVEA